MFWLWMAYQGVDNYFLGGLATFLVHIGWIVVDGEAWILETNHEWNGGYRGFVS